MDRFTRMWTQLRALEGEGRQDPNGVWTEIYGIERRWWLNYFPHWPPSISEAQEFYRACWFDLELEDFPAPLGEEMFYFGINTSLHAEQDIEGDLSSIKNVRIPQAVFQAQMAARSLGHQIKVDGQLGPATRRVLSRSPFQKELTIAFRATAYKYYDTIAGGDRNKLEAWWARMEVR